MDGNAFGMRDDERERREAGEGEEREYEGGLAAPAEGEQERSHESEETLSPDEVQEG